MSNLLNDLFPGMTAMRVDTSDMQTPDGPAVRLSVRTGGQGPALVLLHGHPQTQAMWHRVAGELLRRHTVVLMDLRGYGESDKPAAVSSVVYSKRRMAQDVVDVMTQLGHERFDVCAHDRGARVAHRLALDHPQCVSRLMLLDIAPTLDMYEGTDEAFARAYWHWFFLIQPPPLPERLVGADPVAYLRGIMGSRHAGLGAFDPKAMAHYEHCITLPGTVAAICADYRCAAGIDLAHDRADKVRGHHLAMPLRVLWARHGTVGRRFDVLSLWRRVALREQDVSGQDLDCGHYLAEEQPHEVLAQIEDFFRSVNP